MTFAELSHLFVAYHSRMSAERTTTYYRTQLNLLCKRIGTRDVKELGPGECLLALEEAGRGKASTTQRHTAVALDQVQKWGVLNQIIDRPWLGKIPKPTQNVRTRIPTEDETTAILRRAHKRFRLIYTALRLSGARPGELARAQISDYDTAKGCITLAPTQHKTGRKTGKPRVIVVGKKFSKLLKLAIGKRTSGPIFRSPRGTPWTVNNLSQTYSRLRDAAGLDAELVLYCARHEAGTEFCRREGLFMASQLLGHTSVQTTQRYVHQGIEELRAAQDKSEL